MDLPLASQLVSLGTVLAFERSDGGSTTFWTSDGTAAGTRQLAVVPDADPATPLGRLGDFFLFFVYSRSGVELWRTDGTAGGTLRLVDNDFRGNDLAPEPAVELGGALYFFATSGFQRRGLWRTDGTPAGTQLVHDFRSSGGSTTTPPAFLTAFAGRLYFAADDGVHGRELWASDGLCRSEAPPAAALPITGSA